MLSLGREPVAILGVLDATLNAVQIAAIPMPIWLHTVIAVALIAISAVVARSQVSPVTPTPAPAAPVAPGPAKP